MCSHVKSSSSCRTSTYVTYEGEAGDGRDRLQLLLKEQSEVNLDDVKKYDDADDADSGDDLESSDSDDDSDDEEALERELEKIRKEREDARKKKVIHSFHRTRLLEMALTCRKSTAETTWLETFALIVYLDSVDVCLKQGPFDRSVVFMRCPLTR